MKVFPPVAVEVPRGRVLMVGSADKVDQTRDGVLLVTDIKTGSARTFTVLNDDPVAPAPSFNCRSTRTCTALHPRRPPNRPQVSTGGLRSSVQQW